MVKGLSCFLAGAAAAAALLPLAQHRPESPDNAELTRICDEDQADRQTPTRKIDWTVVGKRDASRLARVKQIYADGGVRTGADLYHAALVLQHSATPEDFLLSHELCVVAIGKGHQDAFWLAAASEDRFLTNIKRPQRFGTQYRSDGPAAPFKLYEVDPQVTDALRSWMHAPSLADAKKREADLNKGG